MSLKFTERAQEVINQGFATAKKNHNPEFTPGHILYAAVDAEEDIIKMIFDKLKISLSNLLWRLHF